MHVSVRGLLTEVSEAVFPSNIYCVCCGALIDRSRPYSLCDSCVGRFHWITGRTCRCCGKAMPDTSWGERCYDCMQREHAFKKGFSCLTYGLHERELMMDLKYAGKGYLARIFGDVMFDRMEAAWQAGASGGEHDIDSIDIVTSVPVSSGRLRKRGYNQSELMARQFVWRWQMSEERAKDRAPDGEDFREADGAAVERAFPPAPVLRPRLLIRTRQTQMLRSLNPAERRLALMGAFAVRDSEKARLEGKRVLLIDDIYTTGATADACSETLLEGGAAAVYLLTLASGGNRRPAE